MASAVVPPIPSFVVLNGGGLKIGGDVHRKSERNPIGASRAVQTARSPRSPRSPRASASTAAALPSTALPAHREGGLVEQLAQIAQQHLSAADILRLREKLTRMLEATTGAATTA
jgi:hypothetical protein